ncbi:MAG: ATP-binding protein [Lachnospiraceae bacterium]|nr:ATP-binding protein [Lachnospiraceae bacterium]
MEKSKTIKKTENGNAKTSESITLDADLTALGEVTLFVNSFMERIGCDEKTKRQTDIAVEEIFVNICNYAYSEDDGKVTVEVRNDGSRKLVLTFSDRGVRYNPLEKPDPDITLGAQDRKIGGLGIYMVKNIMDELSYRHENDKNILTIVKYINC